MLVYDRYQRTETLTSFSISKAAASHQRSSTPSRANPPDQGGSSGSTLHPGLARLAPKPPTPPPTECVTFPIPDLLRMLCLMSINVIAQPRAVISGLPRTYLVPLVLLATLILTFSPSPGRTNNVGRGTTTSIPTTFPRADPRAPTFPSQAGFHLLG